MASRAAASSFVRVYANPEATERQKQYEDRAGRYNYLWGWYTSSVFDTMNLPQWAEYKWQYRLYRESRPIYNPTQLLVDFYAGILYPGILSADGKRAGNMPLAIPLPDDIPDELRSALGQSWQWSNWQARKSLVGRYGAALGDVAIEITDDLERRKVTYAPVWPGLIKDLSLDGNDNVEEYAIEYESLDPETEKPYTYRRHVTKEMIATFRDDQPYSYDENPPEYANPYGFCPLVWIQHTHAGGEHGLPAMRNLVLWDELQSLASHDIDKAHQMLSAPILISGQGVNRAGTDPAKQGSTHDLSDTRNPRETLNIIRGNADAKMQTLNLDPGDIANRLDRLLKQLERLHPELTMYQELREMNQVSGVAAERLLGDSVIYIYDARSNYDQGMIKLFQMALAIAGYRANSGAWGEPGQLDNQRSAFLPFDLSSYEEGDLDFTIEPRPLIPMTEQEELQLERQRQALERDRAAFAIGAIDSQEDTPAGIAQRLQQAGVNTNATNEPEPTPGPT